MYRLVNVFEKNKELKERDKFISRLTGINIIMCILIFYGLCFFYVFYTEPKLAEIEYKSKNYYSYESDSTWSDTPELYYDTENTITREYLARGACVDKAQSILNVLKRRYVSYNRIKCALSPNHVQVIQQDIDGSIEYLDIDNFDVFVSDSEFVGSTIVKIIDPEVFLSAIDFYKPEISINDLNKYITNLEIKGEL